jgi:hypothetical protein
MARMLAGGGEGGAWYEETILRCLIERQAWSWTEGMTLNDLLDCFLRSQHRWPRQTTARRVWPSVLRKAARQGYLVLRQQEHGEQRVVITELGLRQAATYHIPSPGQDR